MKAKDHIAAINIFRIATGNNSFTKNELKQTLKDGGIPSNELFINELRHLPEITQIGKDQFKFTTPQNPIFWTKLDKVYTDYRIKANTYQRNYRNGNKKYNTHS